MTRSRRPQLRATAKCRNITSYFSQAAMKTPISPPPAKRAKVDPLPLPPATATVPPSLPSPSPSPLSPFFSHFPLLTSSLAPNTTTNHPLPTPLKLAALNSTSPLPATLILVSPSPTLPPTPTSPLSPSLVDELENILILRNIDFRRENDFPDQVLLFTRTQACLTNSFLDQIDHMGMTCERLNRLLDYLLLSVSPLRMPSGDIMCQLWNMTTDISVVVHSLTSDVVMKVSSLFHTMLSLHPPSRSRVARTQYRHFVQKLGGGKEASVFSSWLHIKQLLSAPCLHHHVMFLVDLLLSDFWSHVTSSQTGSPLFVSIFWDSPSGSDSMSLPVRQLLESIHHALDQYTGTETEFLVLQSQMVLLYLVMTQCTDMQVMVDLLRLTLRLTDAKFALFLSLLYPLSLHRPLLAHRLQHSLTTRGVATQSGVSPSSSSKLPDINQLHITLPYTPPPTTTGEVLNHVSHSTTLGRTPILTSGTIASQIAHDIKHTPPLATEISSQAALTLADPLSATPPLKIQNIPTASRSSVPTKRPNSQHAHLSKTKKAKLSSRSCENCDFGALVCHRCKPSRI